MKLLTYSKNNDWYMGIVTEGGVIETSLTAVEFYKQGLAALSHLSALSSGVPTLQEADLQLGPITPKPDKIICVGLNYRKHAAESNMAEPPYPVLFPKYSNAIAGPGEDVPMSSDWKQVDYESELVVVMGRTTKNVSEADALSTVLGYCNGNDLSERHLQLRTSQWMPGKTVDKFMPVGPYLITSDEIADPQNMEIKGWLNGELRQNSSTGDMIFSVAQIVSFISSFMTLAPGDIISTGTPEGVIMGRPEDKRQFMQPGDEYTVEIGPLGRLTNRMVEA